MSTEGEHGPQPIGSQPGGPPGRRPPLVTSTDRVDLLARLLDTQSMRAVLERELQSASAAPIRRVLRCTVKPGKTAGSRKASRQRRPHLVYRVFVEFEDLTRREFVVLGMAPVAEDFPGAELGERCRLLSGHPAAAPFRRLAIRVESLKLGLLLFPVDPALPALADVTGPEAAPLFAPFLPECRAGARIERLHSELRHYKPCKRAVLRVGATLRNGTGPVQRSVYAKLFSDGQGEVSHGEMQSLWCAVRGSSMRLPEPLGYDGERRMLVMSEVPGERDLVHWIRALENEEPLPAGVGMDRVQRCLHVAAEALSALQGSGVAPAARRGFEQVMAPLRKDAALLRKGAGGGSLVGRVLSLVERLTESAPRTERLVPSHGGCRHKQTVGNEHTLAFIDWDGFCLADPALDPATFLARLRLRPLTTGRSPALERLAEGFRQDVCRLSPKVGRHLALYEGVVLVEQALRSFRRAGRDGAIADTIDRLVRGAEERLAKPT